MAGLPPLEDRVAAIEAALAALKASGTVPATVTHKVAGVSTPRVYATGAGRSRAIVIHCVCGMSFYGLTYAAAESLYKVHL